jgi:RNA polymerase sigma-70 factor (ECF subfamily)
MERVVTSSDVSDTATTADTPSWPEIVALVHRQMRSLVGPSRDLEDLTQIALERVVTSLGRFERRSELSTFLYRICAHVAIDHFRWWKRWLRRFEFGAEDQDAPAPPADAPSALVEAERTRRLHRALDRMAPGKRLVLTLSDFEELPASRVAEILQCPEGTIRSRLRQARSELARSLREDPLFAEEAS